MIPQGIGAVRRKGTFPTSVPPPANPGPNTRLAAWALPVVTEPLPWRILLIAAASCVRVIVPEPTSAMVVPTEVGGSVIILRKPPMTGAWNFFTSKRLAQPTSVDGLPTGEQRLRGARCHVAAIDDRPVFCVDEDRIRRGIQVTSLDVVR